MGNNFKTISIMALYIVQFYDNQESGGIKHNEVYTSYRMAEKRVLSLYHRMDRYSWVNLYEGKIQFGRVHCGNCIISYSSCDGNYHHGDSEDF